jgi:hypothetical protein
LGRLYKTVKQNPVLNLKQFQTDNGDRELKLSSRSGSDATARAIAEQVGVGQATVRRAEKFADAVEALQEVSPEAAERVLRGEVRDAFVANSQNPAAFAAGWEVGSAICWRCLDFNQVPFIIGFKTNCPNFEELSPRVVSSESSFRNGAIYVRCVNNRERHKVAQKDFFYAIETEKTLCQRLYVNIVGQFEKCYELQFCQLLLLSNVKTALQNANLMAFASWRLPSRRSPRSKCVMALSRQVRAAKVKSRM